MKSAHFYNLYRRFYKNCNHGLVDKITYRKPVKGELFSLCPSPSSSSHLPLQSTQSNLWYSSIVSTAMITTMCVLPLKPWSFSWIFNMLWFPFFESYFDVFGQEALNLCSNVSCPQIQMYVREMSYCNLFKCWIYCLLK